MSSVYCAVHSELFAGPDAWTRYRAHLLEQEHPPARCVHGRSEASRGANPCPPGHASCIIEEVVSGTD